METPERIEFLKEREFSEIINATFAFIRENFLKLGKSIIYIVGPLILLTALFAGFYQGSIFAGDEALGFLGGLNIFYMILSSISSALLAAVVYGFISLYIEKGVSEIEVSDVWRAAKENFLPFIGASILLFIAVFVGLLAFIIPGVMAAIWFSLAYVIIVREGAGVMDAFSRSKDLIKGYWWFTFGLMVVFGIIIFVLSFLVSIPQTILGVTMGFHGTDFTEISSGLRIATIVFTFLSTIVSYVFYSVPLVGIAFQYHNLLERKEATGLMGEIDNISE